MLSQGTTALQVQVWPIDKLIFYARNPRKNDAAVDRMCASINEFGFNLNSEVECPVIVNWTDENGRGADFWRGKDLVAGDGSGLDAIWRIDRFSGIPEQDRFCEEGDGVYADPASLPKFDSSGANLHRVFDLGGGGSAAVCTNQLAARGPRPA